MKRILALSLCIIMAFALVIPAYAAKSPVTSSPTVGSGSSATATNKNEVIAGQNVKTTETTQSKANADGSVTKTSTVKSTADNGTTATTVTTTTTKKDGSVTETVTVSADVSSKAVANAKNANGYVTIPVEVSNGQEVKVNLPSGSGDVKVEIPMEGYATAGTVVVVVDKDGNEKIIKTSVATQCGVAAILDGSVVVMVVDNSLFFVDTTNHWAEDAVDFVASREIFNGIGGNQFGPEETTTRAMVWTVLARFDGADTTTGVNWYDAGADWAKNEGVSDGTNADANITREEFVTMVYRYVGSPAVSGSLAGYSDAAQVSDWATDAMQWAISVGLIQGVGNDTLQPQGNTTRAQLATVIQRFCTTIVM